MKRILAARRAFLGAFMLLSCVLIFGPEARADTPEQVRSELAHALLKQIIYVRHAYQASYLRYDENGHLMNRAEPGSWTDTSAIYPTKVDMSSTALLHVEADRVAIAFEQGKGAWKQIRRDNLSVVIEVQFNQASLTHDKAQKALTAIFVHTPEELAPDEPNYWAPCLTGVMQRDPARGRIYCFSKDVKPDMDSHAPIATDARRPLGLVVPAQQEDSPTPKFTDVARELRFNGSSILWFVLDEEGRPTKIYVASPAGYGLDDEAVQAISRWKFVPAKLNGKPVPVQMTVEVNFKVPRWKRPGRLFR